ncbi:MAG TPA: MFS transporter, partial [Candidatus Polarisedimenticolia bacterium]|nr:MFS transporter [Candidatus Polarisedimenticolia bacterium]
MKHPWVSLEGLPRPVWALFTATLVNRCGTMVLPFMVLYLTHSLGLPPARASLALAAYGVGAVITAPFAGRIADRVGARQIIVTSLFASGTLLLFLPLARSLTAILLTTFIWSITAEALRPASMAWMTDLVPSNRRRAGFALNRLAVNLGMCLGPAIAGFVVQVSFTAIFILDAATSFMAGALLLLATRGSGHDGHPRRRTAAAATAAAEEVASEAPAPAPGIPATHVLRAHADSRFILFLLAVLPVQIVFFQHQSVLPLFLTRDLGLSESAYGLVFTINTLMVIFLEVPLNGMTAEWSHKRALATGAVLVGLGFGGLGLTHGFASVAVMVVIWTFGEMILLPGSSAFVADAAPETRRGEYLGLYSMSFSIAFAVAPWLGTRLMEAAGARVVWAAALACSLFS